MNQALADARVERGSYRCAGCLECFKRDQIHLDHIEPVIPVDGKFNDWNTFIERLFCGPEGLQVLCQICHKVKTEQESYVRRLYKEKRKKNS